MHEVQSYNRTFHGNFILILGKSYPPKKFSIKQNILRGGGLPTLSPLSSPGYNPNYYGQIK